MIVLELLNDTDEDGVCDEDEVSGCVDTQACNYLDLPTIDIDNSLCEYPDQYRDCSGVCLNDTDADGVCDEEEVIGCQDQSADNYDLNATDDGQCEYLGCTDSSALNYNSSANTDDGTCIDIVEGCMNVIWLLQSRC